jgi:hypothetical protein
MLRLVGHPVVVNPDAELHRIARAEGWEVVRFERLGRRRNAAAAESCSARGEESSPRTRPGNSRDALYFL